MDVNNEIINSEATICVNLKNYQFHNRDYILVKGPVLWLTVFCIRFGFLATPQVRES